MLQFTGGTNPSLTKLNEPGTPTLLWQPVPADDLQGKVLGAADGRRVRQDGTVNVGIRNDAYGNGLGDVFKSAWTAQGGQIGKYVVYNPTQPTYDTEAQQLVDGDPAGWLFVDFCANWVKMVGPLQRTGKWDAARSFGGDSLTDCGGNAKIPDAAVPGFRSTAGNVKSGSAFPAFSSLYLSKVGGTTFNSGVSESFDAVFVSFVAAVAAKSDDPLKISPQIPKVTNPPGPDYSFTDLPQVLSLVLAAQPVHFNGAGGGLTSIRAAESPRAPTTSGRSTRTARRVSSGPSSSTVSWRSVRSTVSRCGVRCRGRRSHAVVRQSDLSGGVDVVHDRRRGRLGAAFARWRREWRGAR